MAVRKAEVLFVGDAASLVASARSATAAIAGVTAEAKKAGSASGFGSGVATGLKTAAKVAGESILAFGVVATDTAVKFQKNMELMHTQAGASTSEVNKMSKAVLALGLTTEQGPNALAKALYPIESVGLRGKNAIDALAAASKGAAVGGADLTETTHALAGVMVALHENGSKAAATMGAIDAVVGVGKMTMQDFVDALSSGIVPTAHAVGLSFQSMAAGLATMTDAGVPAEQAATKMRTILLMLADEHTKAAVANLQSVGLTSDELAAAMRKPGNGLLDVLQLLHDHIDKLGKVQQTDILASLAGGSRSAGTLITLEQQLGRVGQKYQMIGTLSGQFNSRVAAEGDTASHKIQVAWSAIQVAFIEAGQKMLPIVSAVLGAFDKFVVGIQKGTGIGGQFRSVVVSMADAVKDVVQWFAKGSAAAEVVVGVLGGLVVGIVAVSAATKAWAIVQGVLDIALTANPIGVVVVAVAALVGGIIMAYEHCKTFRTIVNDAFTAVKTVVSAVVAWMTTAFDNMVHEIESWKTAWSVVTLIGTLVTTAFNVIRTAITTAFDIIVPVIHGGLTAISTVFNAVFPAAAKVVSTAFSVIKQVISAVVGVVTNVVNIVRDILQGNWGKAWDDAKKLVSDAIKAIIGIITTEISGVVNAVIDLGKGILNALANLPQEFFNIGKQIVQGLINGIGNMVSSAVSSVGSFFGGIVNAAKSAVGVHSPSTVFMEIGKNLGQGLIQGLQTIQTSVTAAMTSVADGMVQGFMSQKDMVTEGLNQTLIYPVDAAINALNDRKTQLQAQWSAIDSAAQRSQLVAAVAAAGTNMSTSTASAASTTVTGGRAVRGTVGGLTASQNATARQLFSIFTGAGLSPAGASGLIGNWVQESSLNPGEQGGFLAQWGGSRLSSLTGKYGSHPSTAQQAQFALSELAGMPGLMSMLKGTTNPSAAALAISNQYERPAGWAANNKNREGQAASIFAALSGGGGKLNTVKAVAGNVISGTASGVAQAIAALKQFDTQAQRANQLAKIDLQIKNLQQLNAFKTAITSLKTQVQSLAQQAAQAWNTMQHAAINNGPQAQQLAAMQAQDAAEQAAQQLATLNQALVTAQQGGDPVAIAAAQQAITDFNRQQDEQRLQDTINAQNAAVDNQTQGYQDGLNTQLNSLVDMLAKGKINYATWVQDVNGILAGLNLGSATPTVSTDPTTEAAANAGPGPAGAASSSAPGSSKPTSIISLALAAHPNWGGGRARGGSVQPGYYYTVGERGPETFVPGSAGTILNASQTRRMGGGGDVHIHGNLNVNSHRAAQTMADRLAFRAMIGQA